MGSSRDVAGGVSGSAARPRGPGTWGLSPPVLGIRGSESGTKARSPVAVATSRLPPRCQFEFVQIVSTKIYANKFIQP